MNVFLESPGTESTTTSAASSNPIDDRLRALLEDGSEDATLPEIQGVKLIEDGPHAGLYQITVQGSNGTSIALGRSNWLERASEVHDMVAIGLHGDQSPLNFAPQRYAVESYINVLLNFQKLFPGSHFWKAIQRGIDAGVKINRQTMHTHPVLRKFFGLALNEEPSTIEQQAAANWPPFCPEWVLAKSTKRSSDSYPVYDGSVVAHGSDSKETLLTDGKKRDRHGRIYHVPRNGVVAHRIMDPFQPPSTVIDVGMMNDYGDASRKTRRGRSVKQPMRYREDIQMCFSDSDSLDGGDRNASESLLDEQTKMTEARPTNDLHSKLSPSPALPSSRLFRPLRLQSLDVSHHT